MSWPTVRKHPRSLQEAFPQSYADAIEHAHKATPFQKLADVGFALVLGVIGALLLVHWLAA